MKNCIYGYYAFQFALSRIYKWLSGGRKCNFATEPPYSDRCGWWVVHNKLLIKLNVLSPAEVSGHK